MALCLTSGKNKLLIDRVKISLKIENNKIDYIIIKMYVNTSTQSFMYDKDFDFTSSTFTFHLSKGDGWPALMVIIVMV